MVSARKLSAEWQHVLDNPISAHKRRPVADTCSEEGRPKREELPANWGLSILPDLAAEGPQLIDPIARVKALVYPPGHSAETFIPVIEGLRKIVGDEYVLLNDGELRDGDYYNPPLSHDGFAIFQRADFVPSACVQPDSTEQVQAIVRLANELSFPLWTISVGRNLGYGGSAPRIRGSVIVDMGKRMNRVLEVDVETATVLLEPGVTYVGLYNHLQDIGVGNQVLIDCPDVGGGSVIGNMLDRGVGYSPMGDHFQATCGMEVVLPQGEIIRTGMGAMPNNPSWNLHKYGVGPFTDGIFTQSNFGIVTKVGFHLLPNPGGCRTFMVTFAKDSDVPAIIETTRPLLLQNIIHGVPSLRSVLSDSPIYSRMSDFVDGYARPSEDVIDHIASVLGGRYLLYGCCYGDEEYTSRLLQKVRKAYSSIAGSRVWEREDLPDWHYIHDRAKVFAGIPHFRELGQLKAYPTGAGIFFAPICPLRGKDATRLIAICSQVFAKHGFVENHTMYFNKRTAHVIFGANFDRNIPESKKAALQCVRDMIDAASKEGYGEYRAHIALQDQVMQTFSFNDGAQLKYFETIKDALDPKGVISPGRYGIFPKSYRGKGWELWGGESASDPALRTLG